MERTFANANTQDDEQEDPYEVNENDVGHDNSETRSHVSADRTNRYEVSFEVLTMETRRHEVQALNYNSSEEMDRELLHSHSGTEEFQRNNGVEIEDLPPDTSLLVDCVPLRSDCRVRDASTVAAVDPLDLGSENDDLAPEEQDYGPVVDVTPVVQPSSTLSEFPSGTGSTSVFAPQSIAADDLDEEDSATLSQSEQKEEWDGRIKISEDDEPNPQSGNDEPVEPAPDLDEQLVDFLPPINDNALNDTDDVAREALSEMTVGGAQSFLQTGDPVEEDFGPVVDLTPFLPSETKSTMCSLDSDGAQAVENNEETDISTIATVGTGSRSHLKSKVVVDPLPTLISNAPIDSTATAGRSESTEEEEDDASTRFGPVVDQLPTSRAWTAPSRGGSTVDALANVSEANSDEDDNEEEDVGWDDGDYDASLGGASESTGRYGMISPRRSLRNMLGTHETDKSVTVRFDSSVTGTRISESDNRSVTFSQPSNYDDVVVTSSMDEATNFDLASQSKEDDVNGGESLNDNSLNQANTPLSTPGRHFFGVSDLKCLPGQFSLELPTLGNGASLPSWGMSAGFDTIDHVSYVNDFRQDAKTDPYSLHSKNDGGATKDSLHQVVQNEQMLISQVQQLREERDGLREDKASLTSQLEECRKQVTTLNASISSLEKKDAEQQELLGSVQDSLQKSKDKVGDLIQVSWELARLAITNIPAAQSGFLRSSLDADLAPVASNQSNINSDVVTPSSKKAVKGRISDLSKVVARLHSTDQTVSPNRRGNGRDIIDALSAKGRGWIDSVQSPSQTSSNGEWLSSIMERSLKFAEPPIVENGPANTILKDPPDDAALQTCISQEADSNDSSNTFAQNSTSLEDTKAELAQATKRISDLTESEQNYVESQEIAKTLTIELEYKVAEKKRRIQELESVVTHLQGNLTEIKKYSESEISDIVSIFNQETLLLQNKLQMSMAEIKEREAEVCHFQEKLRHLINLNTATGIDRYGLGVLSTTGVTIRTDDERSKTRDDLHLLSNTNRGTMNALQENMKNYLESI